MPNADGINASAGANARAEFIPWIWFFISLFAVSCLLFVVCCLCLTTDDTDSWFDPKTPAKLMEFVVHQL
jgi:hypothetical protein